MTPVKHYVDVSVRFDTLDNMNPLTIYWPDGREFEIDRVLGIKNCASESGGAGRRYTVRVLGKTRRLFYANDYRRGGILCWFVESTRLYKKAEDD